MRGGIHCVKGRSSGNDFTPNANRGTPLIGEHIYQPANVLALLFGWNVRDVGKKLGDEANASSIKGSNFCRIWLHFIWVEDSHFCARSLRGWKSHVLS